MSMANLCSVLTEEDESKKTRNTTANQTPSKACCSGSGSGRGVDASTTVRCGGSSIFGKGMVWADVSEDDAYDEDESFWDADKTAKGKDVDAIDSSDEEEDEEGDEGWTSGSSSDSEEPSIDRRIIMESNKGEQQQTTKCLSKKEQKKLELQDLGAALAELGIAVPVAAVPDVTDSPAEKVTLPVCASQSAAEGVFRTGKKKRKSKKNAALNKNNTDIEDVGEHHGEGKVTTPSTKSEMVDTPAVGNAAISRDEAVHRIKNRQTNKPKKQGTVLAHATVLAEAKKRSDKKPRLKKSEKLTQYQK